MIDIREIDCLSELFDHTSDLRWARVSDWMRVGDFVLALPCARSLEGYTCPTGRVPAPLHDVPNGFQLRPCGVTIRLIEKTRQGGLELEAWTCNGPRGWAQVEASGGAGGGAG